MVNLDKKQLGNWGEALAQDYLVRQGYAILERNWKMGHLEIDIIAQTADKIVFVEVKTRKDPTQDPIEAVDRRKRSRIISSADAYMRRYDIPFEYRFDIIAVSGTPESFTIEHIPDAYVPPLKRINYSFRL